jgi:hypothetical protein
MNCPCPALIVASSCRDFRWLPRPLNPVPQLGPGLLPLDAPADHPPGPASIVLRVDQSERRWDIRLPNGISAASKRVTIAHFTLLRQAFKLAKGIAPLSHESSDSKHTTCQAHDGQAPNFEILLCLLASAHRLPVQLHLPTLKSRELSAVHYTGFIVAEAGQIYRPTPNSDHGIDGEIEFKDDQSRGSGNRLYVQLKSGDSYLKKRRSDGADVFQIKNPRWADCWQQQA